MNIYIGVPIQIGVHFLNNKNYMSQGSITILEVLK